ncbi:MAG: hypothetical protein D6800_02325, partial [Candidatus Zixiibacteriota bacterium]
MTAVYGLVAYLPFAIRDVCPDLEAWCLFNTLVDLLVGDTSSINHVSYLRADSQVVLTTLITAWCSSAVILVFVARRRKLTISNIVLVTILA